MKSVCLFIIITTLLVLPFTSNAQDAAPEEYIVRTVYFLAKDRNAIQDIDESLSNTVKRVQKFYADYMEKYGFGRKTFKYEPDANGDVLVHHVIGTKNSEAYRKSPLSCFNEQLVRRIQTRNTVLLVFMDHGSGTLGNACGLAISGRRSLVPAKGQCYRWPVVAHEIGHNFVLQHDYRPDGGIMGGPTNGLSRCAAEWLNLNPFFNGGKISDIENGVKINVFSTIAYPTDNLHAFFEITDQDGLYHVRFLHQTLHQHSCATLTGERAVVHLDMATVDNNRVNVQTVDINGNARYPGWFSFNDIEPSMVLDIAIDRPDTDDGLIGYWTYDEATGKYVFDGSGNNRYARLSNGAILDSKNGKIGGAMRLDGSQQFATVTNSAELINGLSAFTLCLWVKSNQTDTDRGFINGRTPNDKDEFFGFRYDKDAYNSSKKNVIKAGITTTEGTHVIESSGNVQTTEWQHLAFTWQSGNVMKLYINGNLNNPSFTQPAVKGTITNVDRLIIGRGGKDKRSSWNGLIDDVRLYNRVLSLNEIRNLPHVDSHAPNIHGLTLTAATKVKTELVDPGTDLIYTLTVTNTGNKTDTFSFTKSGHAAVMLNRTSSQLSPGSSETLTLTIPKEKIALADKYAVSITATSQGDPTKTAKVNINTTVNPAYDFIMEGVNGYSTEGKLASSKIEYPFKLTNTGNTNDTIHLTTSGDAIGTFSQTDITLAPGESKEVKLTFPSNAFTATGDYAIKVTATSQGDATKTIEHTTIVYVFSGSADDTNLNNGLISHWKFNETDGNSTADARGNNNGTLGDGVSFAPNEGVIGGAVRFDGNSDGVDIPNARHDINGLNAFTLSLWIKSDAINTDRGLIFPKNPNGEDEIFSLRYDDKGSSGGGKNVIKAGITSTGGKQTYESTSNAQTRDWQHLTLTWRSGRGLTLYINGTVDQPTFNTPATHGTITGVNRLLIGRGSKDQGSSWKGLIDEVRLYNRVLRPSEIMELTQNVQIELPSRTHGLRLDGKKDLTIQEQDAKTDVIYNFILTNTGDTDDTIKLKTAGDVIGTLNNESVTLTPGESTEGTLTIPASALTVLSKYVVRIKATSTVDNTKTAEIILTIKVTGLVEDINGDGIVNIQDLVIVAGKIGESGEELVGDVNNDGTVNILDLVQIANKLGETQEEIILANLSVSHG